MSGAFHQTRLRSPTDSTEAFVLTLWTDDLALARRADAAGVQRIGVDLERLGKLERQRGRRTWISTHTIDDLAAIGTALTRARLFARMNPLHAGSPGEVEATLEAGAAVLMLPMVVSPGEVATFVRLVDARARVILLVERREAIDRLRDLVAVDGVHEIHLGLNDLALSLGLPNRWLVLASDIPTRVASCVLGAGLRFGLGGIGRVGDDTLPVSSDLIFAEYARTGASAALISRSFIGGSDYDLTREVARVHTRLAAWRRRGAQAVASAHAELVRCASELREW